MNSNKLSQPRRLQQQQPQYPANRQQQQSSGSGEFQPRRFRPTGEAFCASTADSHPPQR